MIPTLAALALAGALAPAAAQWQPGKGSDVLVDVAGGTLRGKHDPDEGVNYFLSVPYAASTAGANRFQPPQPRAPWTGALNVTDYGLATASGCYSDHHNPDTSPNPSEDCLGVDIFAPSEATASSKLPVLVWFYGGSFEEGFAEGPFNIYNGVYLASTHKVVVVAVNYRLGPLGFATLTDIGIEGNMGLRDQTFALQWVQDNVAVFGGDPAAVTIWGESAGAMSVGLHLVSPSSAGLFSKAIMESNVAAIMYQTQEDANILGMKFCEEAGCASGLVDKSCNMTCLQDIDWPTVEHAWKKAEGAVWTYIEQNWRHLVDGILPFKPIVDGKWLPDQVQTLLAQDKMADVPVLFSSNTGEGYIFIYPAITFPVNTLEYIAALDVIFGVDNSAKIRARPEYKALANGKDERSAISQIFTDYLFRCSSENFALAAERAGNPAWAGLYAHVFHNMAALEPLGLPAVCTEYVCHATELPFTWHNEAPSLNITFSPSEEELSRRMVDRWMSFAKTGNPDAVPSPSGLSHLPWPAFNSSSRLSLRMNLTDTVDPSSQDLCTFWAEVGYDH